MSDSGLARGSATALNIHTETGCSDYEVFRYTGPFGEPLAGEACANGTHAGPLPYHQLDFAASALCGQNGNACVRLRVRPDERMGQTTLLGSEHIK